MELSILANIATISLFLGTIPSLLNIYKNRHSLEGFSSLGSFGLFCGQVLFMIYFALVGDWITMILLLPLAIFWGMVIIYKRILRNFGDKGISLN